MNFVFSSVAFEEYKVLFEKVVKFYLGLFEDTKLFQSKLFFTNVCLTYVKGENESTSEVRCLSSGYEISMEVSESDRKDYILHQFSHELAHLILMPMRYNSCVSVGFNSSDDSYAVTTLTRKSGTVTYGILFEEAFCNWLALKAVNFVLEKDYTNSEYISKYDISLIDTVVSAFEIFSHDKWDTISRDGVPANSFLFGISCGDISYAISCVDSIMGKGSWKGLMYSSYLYLTDSPERKEAGWRIKLLLKEFKKSFKFSFKEAKKYA